MWPFRRTKAPRVDSVDLAEISFDPEDYPVLTVGQSRLGQSFLALDFDDASEARFTRASLRPIRDPGLKTIADVEIRVDEHVVGYLRPPALTSAIALLEEHRAASLGIPVMIFATPAGPEVRVHASLT